MEEHLSVLEGSDPVDHAAVERALSHPVFDELFDRIVSESMEESVEPTLARHGTPRRPAGPHWRVPVAAAAAVVVLLGLLAGVGVIGGGRGLRRPFTTAWKAGRPFVHTTSRGAATRRGTWRLVDALLTGTWQQNVFGPPPGSLSCSPEATCYVLSATYLSASAATPVSETLYVSTNDGATWSALPVPSGLRPTTQFECGSPQWCAMGATYNGQPVLAVTSDGGHSFTIDPLPTGVGTLRTLSCPSTDVCMGLVSAVAASSTSGPVDATLLVTDDGGSRFHDEPVLPGDSMIDLACTSRTDCTAVGVTDASMNTRPPVGVSAVTSNQGRTWTVGSFPVGFGITRGLFALSCPDAMHCFAMGYLPMRVQNPPQCSTRPTPTTTSPGQSTALPDMSPKAKAISERETKILEAEEAKQATRDMVTCSGRGTTQFSVIAKSSNGGITWTLEVPPSDVPRPYLTGLACPTATECWAGGQESVPVKVGTMGVDMGSPVLIGTTNGGSTWSKVVFSVPATAPNPTGQSYLSMGSVACPTPSICVASGAAAQNARYAPVYSFVVPGG